jgi:hypothetical protein
MNAALKRYDVAVSSKNFVDSKITDWSFAVTAVDASTITFSRRRANNCRVDTSIAAAKGLAANGLMLCQVMD